MSSDLEEERDEIAENDRNIPSSHSFVSVKYIGLFSLAVFFYDLSEVYFKTVFPTIENRFVFDGQNIHWVASFVLFTTVFFSFVKQKTKILGVCCAGLAIGNIIIILPFFIFGLSFSKDDKLPGEVQNTCHPSDEVNKLACKEDVVGEFKGKVTFWFLLISRIFISFGQAGLLPLGLSHFYENSRNGWNYLFIGIVICWKTLGSVLAKYLVVLVKKLPETIVVIHKYQSNEGAWWLGFIIFSLSLGALIVPFVSFRKVKNDSNISNRRQLNLANNNVAALTTECNQPKSLPIDKYDLKIYLKRHFTNIPLFLFIISEILKYFSLEVILLDVLSFLYDDYGSFTYLKNIPLTILYTSIICFAGVFSGILLKKIKLELNNLLRLILVSTIIFLAGILILSQLKCEKTQIVGIDNYKTNNLYQPCNSNCSCLNNFEPVCGDDGNNYFSACFAGCLTDNITFSNCGCIESPLQTAKLGLCAKSFCPSEAFIVLTIYLITIEIFNRIASIDITMRLADRGFSCASLTTTLFLTNLFVWIPVPLVYQKLVNNYCLTKSYQCPADNFCQIYDSQAVRKWIYVTSIFLLLISILLKYITYRLKKQ